MEPVNSLSGFEDVLPAQSGKWQAVERIARETAAIFHYQEIRTPVLEATTLFHRGVGEGSDIVQKETYSFTARGGESVTLRPEGTAGVVRAVIESKLAAQEGTRVKVFYLAPNFRSEKPQKGRLRQHHQFGAEAFGVADAAQDVECMLLQLAFYRGCGLKDLSLRINSLGDAESKEKYRGELVKRLSPARAGLSEDSQRRLETNPLRILDSKDPRDAAACRGLPPAHEFLSAASKAHHDAVLAMLREAGVEFTADGTLVRGFDYYTETIWEVTASGLGSQNAIGGGGRYDKLVESLGGRPTPGVGFGSGLERLLIALEAQGVKLEERTAPLVWLIAHSPEARGHNWALLNELRKAGIAADMDLSGRSAKAQFKMADREKARFCIIVGETELKEGRTALKDYVSGAQVEVSRGEIVARLIEELGKLGA